MKASFLIRTKQQFSSWSRLYDSRLFRLYFEPLYYRTLLYLDAVIQRADLEQGHVLDIACGTGEVLIRLSKSHPRMKLTGVDLAPKMLEVARKKDSEHHIQWIEGDSAHLPFKSESFDLLLCSEAFHHFFQPQQTLQEMKRVLSEEGFLLLIDPGANSWGWNLLFNRLGRMLELMNRCYSKEELATMLARSGFLIEQHFVVRGNNFFFCRKIRK